MSSHRYPEGGRPTIPAGFITARNKLRAKLEQLRAERELALKIEDREYRRAHGEEIELDDLSADGPPVCAGCGTWLDGGNDQGICRTCAVDPGLDGSE